VPPAPLDVEVVGDGGTRVGGGVDPLVHGPKKPSPSPSAEEASPRQPPCSVPSRYVCFVREAVAEQRESVFTWRAEHVFPLLAELQQLAFGVCPLRELAGNHLELVRREL
jgi:hypothetical protein